MVSLIQKDVLILMLLAGVLLLAHDTEATPIYKSVDAEGNVTYSSHPPSTAVHIEKFSLPSNFAVDTDALINIDAIKQAADQLELERKQREQERKDAQKEAAEEEAKQTQAPPEKEIHYYPAYPLYGYPRRPHPPRPHPPRPRPPHNPVPDRGTGDK